MYRDKENRSLYRGLRYIEVRYIEVPLYWGEEYQKRLSVKHNSFTRLTKRKAVCLLS